MKPIRLDRHLSTLAGLALLAAALFGGCGSDPEAPDFANPFDPENPASVDPLGLRAVYANGAVTLTWTTPPGHGIAGYIIHWVYLDTNYEIARVGTATAEMTYVVPDPVANMVNRYRVQALDGDGNTAAISHVVPAEVMVPPILELLEETPAQIRSRYQDLRVRAAAGDTVQVDTRRDFATAVAAPIAADSTASFPDFDLGPRAGDALTLRLYARASFTLGGGLPPIWSATDSLALTIVFAPTILQADSSATIAAPLVDLLVSHAAAGVDSMRFATSAEDLASAPWRPGAEIATDVDLRDTAQPQTVHAEFLSEFGFTRPATLQLTADDLAAADFRLVLPGNRVSLTREVPVACDAQATEMRISQSPDFAGSPWVPYAPATEIVLAGDPGLKVIYAQFRNRWYESPVRTDFAILSGASVLVQFTHPVQDLILEGGTTIDVSGIADTFDGDYPITAVAVHVGDGWQPAAGTTNWEAVWDVPRLERDTEWLIGARATAENAEGEFQTGTAWISVTISQLTVAITAPVEAAEIVRGTTVAIAGTATPFLAGAPIDSLVVVAQDQRLPAAPPFGTWQVNWTAPAGEDTTPVDITAWVYAGADSLNDRVTVTLVPPPPPVR